MKKENSIKIFLKKAEDWTNRIIQKKDITIIPDYKSQTPTLIFTNSVLTDVIGILVNSVASENKSQLKKKDLELLLLMCLVSEGVDFPRLDELRLSSIPKLVLVHCIAILIGATSGALIGGNPWAGMIASETALLINILSDYLSGDQGKNDFSHIREIEITKIRNGEVTKTYIKEILKRSAIKGEK